MIALHERSHYLNHIKIATFRGVQPMATLI
jgi:hypothetical protein